jgi:hypothetical protein
MVRHRRWKRKLAPPECELFTGGLGESCKLCLTIRREVAMQGRKPEPALKRSSAALVAALCLAVFLGPLSAAAQTSPDGRRESIHERAHEAAEKRKREAAEKHARTQTHQREAAEKRKHEAQERRQHERPQAQDRRQQAIERERWERQEIVRRQNTMRDADDERAEIRARQNADWENDMQRRRDAARQGAQPAAPGPYSLPGTQSAPARSTTPRASTSSGTTCSANPYCPAANGYGNACMGVKRSYSGTGAAQTGLRDIVRRCQTANAPDLCSTDLGRSFGGGCAQQCVNVASCSTTAAR